MANQPNANDLGRPCPACAGPGGPILWGMPSRDAWTLSSFLDVAVGGCCVPIPRPGWRCSTCELDFGAADEVDWSPMDRLVEYRDAVSREMKRVYGIRWKDASGEWEPLAKALRDRETAEQFVAWWGEKYDLAPVTR